MAINDPETARNGMTIACDTDRTGTLPNRAFSVEGNESEPCVLKGGAGIASPFAHLKIRARHSVPRPSGTSSLTAPASSTAFGWRADLPQHILTMADTAARNSILPLRLRPSEKFGVFHVSVGRHSSCPPSRMTGSIAVWMLKIGVESPTITHAG